MKMPAEKRKLLLDSDQTNGEVKRVKEGEMTPKLMIAKLNRQAGSVSDGATTTADLLSTLLSQLHCAAFRTAFLEASHSCSELLQFLDDANTTRADEICLVLQCLQACLPDGARPLVLRAMRQLCSRQERLNLVVKQCLARFSSPTHAIQVFSTLTACLEIGEREILQELMQCFNYSHENVLVSLGRWHPQTELSIHAHTLRFVLACFAVANQSQAAILIGRCSKLFSDALTGLPWDPPELTLCYLTALGSDKVLLNPRLSKTARVALFGAATGKALVQLLAHEALRRCKFATNAVPVCKKYFADVSSAAVPDSIQEATLRLLLAVFAGKQSVAFEDGDMGGSDTNRNPLATELSKSILRTHAYQLPCVFECLALILQALPDQYTHVFAFIAQSVAGARAGSAPVKGYVKVVETALASNKIEEFLRKAKQTATATRDAAILQRCGVVALFGVLEKASRTPDMTVLALRRYAAILRAVLCACDTVTVIEPSLGPVFKAKLQNTGALLQSFLTALRNSKEDESLKEKQKQKRLANMRCALKDLTVCLSLGVYRLSEPQTLSLIGWLESIGMTDCALPLFEHLAPACLVRRNKEQRRSPLETLLHLRLSSNENTDDLIVNILFKSPFIQKTRSSRYAILAWLHCLSTAQHCSYLYSVLQRVLCNPYAFVPVEPEITKLFDAVLGRKDEQKKKTKKNGEVELDFVTEVALASMEDTKALPMEYIVAVLHKLTLINSYVIRNEKLKKEIENYDDGETSDLTTEYGVILSCAKLCSRLVRTDQRDTTGFMVDLDGILASRFAQQATDFILNNTEIISAFSRSHAIDGVIDVLLEKSSEDLSKYVQLFSERLLADEFICYSLVPRFAPALSDASIEKIAQHTTDWTLLVNLLKAITRQDRLNVTEHLVRCLLALRIESIQDRLNVLTALFEHSPYVMLKHERTQYYETLLSEFQTARQLRGSFSQLLGLAAASQCFGRFLLKQLLSFSAANTDLAEMYRQLSDFKHLKRILPLMKTKHLKKAVNECSEDLKPTLLTLLSMRDQHSANEIACSLSIDCWNLIDADKMLPCFDDQSDVALVYMAEHFTAVPDAIRLGFASHVRRHLSLQQASGFSLPVELEKKVLKLARHALDDGSVELMCAVLPHLSDTARTKVCDGVLSIEYALVEMPRARLGRLCRLLCLCIPTSKKSSAETQMFDALLPVLLSRYQARLNDECDEAIIKLIFDLDALQIVDLSRHAPLAWGSSMHEAATGGASMLWSKPSPNEILHAIDSTIMMETALHFPLDLRLDFSTVGNPSSNAVKDPPSAKILYDPRYFLSLFDSLVDSESSINLQQFVSKHCVALCLAALSSRCDEVRLAATSVLTNFSSLAKDQKALQSSVHILSSCDGRRLPFIHTLFLSRVVGLLCSSNEDDVAFGKHLSRLRRQGVVMVELLMGAREGADRDRDVEFGLALMRDGVRDKTDVLWLNSTDILPALLCLDATLTSAPTMDSIREVMLTIVSSCADFFNSNLGDCAAYLLGRPAEELRKWCRVVGKLPDAADRAVLLKRILSCDVSLAKSGL